MMSLKTFLLEDLRIMFIISFILCVFLIMPSQGLADTPQGHIDGLSYANGNYSVGGWACIAGSAASINVALYYGAPAWSQGTFGGNTLANRPSEPAIAGPNYCASTGTAYRFVIPLSFAYATQKIYIHAISPTGVNPLLGNSGAFSVPADTQAPMINSFTIPATSHSLVISPITLTATDNAGVTGYLITESSTKPLSSAAGWASSPPSSFSFSTEGVKTLYAWAKDAAGNVSVSRSATTTVITALGQIDGLSQPDANGNYSVGGWACIAGSAASINVALYYGAPAWSQGTFGGNTLANRPSEPAIAGPNYCASTGTAYRFVIPLSSAYATQKIYIHAINPSGVNPLLGNSGVFSVPAPLPATDLAITNDQDSPRIVGTSITFSASASGGSGRYEYYFAYRVTTAAQWTLGQAYNPNSRWTWNTTGLSAGQYNIRVMARSIGSSGNPDVFKALNYVLSLDAYPQIQACLNHPPADPICDFTTTLTGTQMLSNTLTFNQQVTLRLGNITLVSDSNPVMLLNASQITLEGLNTFVDADHEKTIIQSRVLHGGGILTLNDDGNQGLKGITIRGLKLQGTSPPETSPAAKICQIPGTSEQYQAFGIIGYGASNWQIDNNYITGWCNVGIMLGLKTTSDNLLHGSHDNNIVNNNVNQNQGEGILVYESSDTRDSSDPNNSPESDNNIVQGNIVSSNGSNGIDVNGSQNNQILNNIVQNNGLYCHEGDRSGIMLTPPANKAITNTLIQGNIVSGNKEYGIVMGGSSNGSFINNEIACNVINGNGLATDPSKNVYYAGLRLGHDAMTGNYNQNIIFNNIIKNNLAYGILFSTGFSSGFSGNVIQSNTINGNTRIGIFLVEQNASCMQMPPPSDIEGINSFLGNPEGNVLLNNVTKPILTCPFLLSGSTPIPVNINACTPPPQ